MLANFSIIPITHRPKDVVHQQCNLITAKPLCGGVAYITPRAGISVYTYVIIAKKCPSPLCDEHLFPGRPGAPSTGRSITQRLSLDGGFLL